MKEYVEWNKLDPKEDILCISNYMKVKNRQN